MVSIFIVVFICQHVVGHFLYEIKETSHNCRGNKEMNCVLLFLTHVNGKSWRKVKKTMPSYSWVTKNVANISLVRAYKVTVEFRGGHSKDWSLLKNYGQVTLNELRAGHLMN